MTDTEAETGARRAPKPVRDGQPARGAVVNVWLMGAVGALSLAQLFVVPLWLIPANPAWGWLLLTVPLMTTPFWSLVHEAIHGTLLASRTRSDRCGRVLAIIYGAPFILLKTGHLLHHRFSRTPRERVEIYDPRKTTWAKAAPVYYLRLVIGLYLLEVLSVALAILPAAVLRRLAVRAESPDTVAGLLLDRIAADRNRGQFHIDAALIVLLYSAAFVAYGSHAWMLALAIVGRAIVVSISDNAYHYGTKLDAPLEAMNLKLAAPLERFALSFNLHDVHHRHPGLRWYELRGQFLAEGSPYHLGWFAAAARQFNGPIRLDASAGRAEPD
jgi:fatty acid desaturase